MLKKRLLSVVLLITISAGFLTACSSSQDNSKVDGTKSIAEITQLAKKEGAINSLGMPDDWANWKDTWTGMEQEYGLTHKDTDMSSSAELSKFEAEKTNATGDIGDVGIAFGPLAVDKKLTIPFKSSYYKDVPDWAKDKDGNWVIGYTGTIAIITDKTKVANPPKSWDDIANGKYKVTIGDVEKANESQFILLSCAYAHGGSEKNIEPGLKFFQKLAQEGRLVTSGVDKSKLEKGEIQVSLTWDFNALGWSNAIDKSRFDVRIPAEGSVTSGYCTVINKYAKHPYAAMLTREYALSDKGQSNFAKGYARPIRKNAVLEPDAKAKLLPDAMYDKVKNVGDSDAWNKLLKDIPKLWQDEVLSKLAK